MEPTPSNPASAQESASGLSAFSSWFAAEVQPHESQLKQWLEVQFPSLLDHDDLVQESFLRVLRARAAGPIYNPRGFLFTIARNLALNHLRHRRYSQPNGLGEIDPLRVVDEQANTPEMVAREQELALLQDAIKTLPARCRQVFVLRRIAGLSQKEIAAQLGLSEKTVENQCVLALQRCVEYFRSHDALAAGASLRPERPLVAASALRLTNPEAHHA